MKPRALAFVLLGCVVAAILFALLKPPDPEAPATPVISQSPTGPAVPIAEPPPPPVAASFDFVIRSGERVAGPVAMRARQGEDVAIKVTSDAADEIHLHGYDLHTPVSPNQPVALFFKATHAGRFEVELHKSGVALGVLEVMPR